MRAEQVSARRLACSCTALALVELLHTAVARQWSASPGMDPAIVSLLTSSWGASSHLLPDRLCALAVVLLFDFRRSVWILTGGLVVLAVGLFVLFVALPPFTAPGLLGMTVPSLVVTPFLWLAVGAVFWRYRDRNAMTRPIALMAALLVIPHAVVLYSTGPEDAPALFAHLGALVGWLFLLMSMTQLGARSSAQLVRAEHDLQVFNAELERRIRERTAALVSEAGERREAEQQLLTQVDRLRLLDQIPRAIGDRLDLGSIFQVLVRSLEDRLPVDLACVCIYDPGRHVLRVSNVGVASLPLARELAMAVQAEIGIDNNGLSRCVAGELVYEADVAAVPYPFPERLAKGGLRSMVIAPLLVVCSLFGVLVLVCLSVVC